MHVEDHMSVPSTFSKLTAGETSSISKQWPNTSGAPQTHKRTHFRPLRRSPAPLGCAASPYEGPEKPPRPPKKRWSLVGHPPNHQKNATARGSRCRFLFREAINVVLDWQPQYCKKNQNPGLTSFHLRCHRLLRYSPGLWQAELNLQALCNDGSHVYLSVSLFIHLLVYIFKYVVYAC